MNIANDFSRKHLAINKVKEKKIMEINQDYNNKKCFDCESLNPQYISLYNGIFICRRCANQIHKNLNSKISLILDNNLHNLSIDDIQYLYYGGNKKLLDFIDFEYPILKTINKNKFYLTKGMEYYRRWLKFLIDEGEKPLKPSFEECRQLINDLNINKNNNKNKGNIITIDFINNYYNYEGEDKNNLINQNIYEKTYTTHFVNHINHKSDFGIYEKENDFSLTNNVNTEYYYNNRTILTEKEKTNYYYRNNDYYNLNKKKATIDKYNVNFNNRNNSNSSNNSNNNNKLIIKRLNLKSKNNHKSPKQNLNINKNDTNTNIINKTLVNMIKNENKKIYTKPKHTLLSSFQKNAPTRKRGSKEEFTSIRKTYLIPTRNNYQNIVINNNNFDKLLMYNLTDRTNHFNGRKTVINNREKSRDFYNSMNYLNSSDNSENNSNTDINKEIVFKKKTLKNSFSIHSRKRKDKKDSFNSNKSMMENTNFQIIPDRRLETSINEKNHLKLNTTMSNNNNNFSIDNKKENEILNEIKVKKREKFIIAENKNNNNNINKYFSKKHFETNLNKLKDNNNSNNDKKEIKMKKLLTLTKLINNKGKIEISKSNLSSNNTLINERKIKLSETESEKEMFIDNYKNKILSNKQDKTNHPLNEKKIKEIYLAENLGRKIKVYKTDINNNIDKIKSKKTLIKNLNQNQNIIKRNNNNLKENRTNENINEHKNQKKRDLLNYLLTKK